jgi:hypothetical protein
VKWFQTTQWVQVVKSEGPSGILRSLREDGSVEIVDDHEEEEEEIDEELNEK